MLMRIDEMPDYRAQLPKSVHDLSHKFGFTASTGHLLPVFHDIANPGETYDLSFNYNLRTMPLSSAAMVDIKAHVEYFFVPMFLLYEPFGSMFYDVKDEYSSLYPNNDTSDSVLNSFPVLAFTGNDSVNAECAASGSTTYGFENFWNQVYRLFDHFGFNNMSLNATGVSTLNFNPNVFPWQLLAYQCIYQYYYRLDTREKFNQFAFNWDKFYNTAVVDGTMTDLVELMRIHYRPKDSDYFTDVKISPIVDVLNLNKKDGFNLAQQWLTRSGVSITSSSGTGYYPVLSPGNQGSDSNSPFINISPNSSIQTQFGLNNLNNSNFHSLNGADIGTANIRAMFANEKFWSITGRARKHYDDQTLAHFGIKVPHDVKHSISCFGHDRGVIHIGEVINTSNVSVSNGSLVNGGLADIAGKGYGNLQNKSHRFTAPCHGVIMAILSFVPDVTYEHTYLKCNAVSSRQDLFIPSFDHLGMQPLFGYEGTMNNASQRNSIIGWQYRYEQWKRRFNRVSRAFANTTGPFQTWMLTFNAPTHMAAPNDYNSAQAYLQYCHSPYELNQLFLVNYVTQEVPSSSNQETAYSGDPFIVDGFIYCKKRSSMSDFSLPRLDA